MCHMPMSLWHMFGLVFGCTVYRLGPRSWKPDVSLSQSVSAQEIEEISKLSHGLLASLASTDDDVDDVDPVDRTSSQLSRPTNPAAAADVVSSRHHSVLTWSASGGVQHSVANDDDDAE